ncbi:PAS domain-containing sensor histidine kinase [Haloplanus ruber]|uniref:histidine kinase n=1 Tax=Haloplanus ruber TaxID=869892 RepID=A0ABD6D2P2_9EURY
MNESTVTAGADGGGLLERIPDGVVVYDPDTGMIRAVNARFVALTGFDRERLVGRHVADLLADGARTGSASGLTVDPGDDTTTVEWLLERRDGGSVWAELSASRFERDGEARIVATVRDVTDRKRRRAELGRFEELVEHVPTGIFRSKDDPEGTFLEANPTMVDLFGADSKAELLSTPMGDIYADPDDRQRFLDAVADTNVVTEKLELQTLDGESFWGLVTVCRCDPADGDPYLDGAIKDVTEAREYREVLEEQNERLELLNRIVRHDIRNDMQLVQGMTDLLDNVVAEGNQPQLETIRSRTDHVIELTDVMGDLMETLVSETDPTLEPVHLSYVLNQEMREVRSSYPAATIRTSGNVPLVEVVANDMLGSVFRNLLNNAVQHSDRDEPSVTVSASATDDAVTVRVADDGPGIPDDRKERVFGKGEKGIESEGTGLGLYLVYTLVDQYGGEVWIEDNDPCGTVFVLQFERAS